MTMRLDDTMLANDIDEEQEGESWVKKYIRERTWADKILKE